MREKQIQIASTVNHCILIPTNPQPIQIVPNDSSPFRMRRPIIPTRSADINIIGRAIYIERRMDGTGCQRLPQMTENRKGIGCARSENVRIIDFLIRKCDQTLDSCEFCIRKSTATTTDETIQITYRTSEIESMLKI